MKKNDRLTGLRRVLGLIAGKPLPAAGAGRDWPAAASALARALDRSDEDGAQAELPPERLAALLASYRATALTAEERAALERRISSSPAAYWDAVSAVSFIDEVEANPRSAPRHLVEAAVAKATAGRSNRPPAGFWRRWLPAAPRALGGWRAAAAFATLALAVWPVLSLLEHQEAPGLESPMARGASAPMTFAPPSMPMDSAISGSASRSGVPAAPALTSAPQAIEAPPFDMMDIPDGARDGTAAKAPPHCPPESVAISEGEDAASPTGMAAACPPAQPADTAVEPTAPTIAPR